MTIIAETERLILRTEQPGDQQIWLAHMNTPEVTSALGGPRTRKDIAENFTQIAQDWETRGMSLVMLERKSDGMLIGDSGIAFVGSSDAPQSLQGQPQIGWLLREDCWGQGYAQEAARAVLVLAFGPWDLPIVYAQTSLSNPRSWVLMEKLGMQRRTDLDYMDDRYPPADNPTVVYDLHRTDWTTARKDHA